MWFGGAGTIILLTVALLSTVSSVLCFFRLTFCKGAVVFPVARLNFALSSCALLILATAFLGDRFEIEYVALNSNTFLPDFYKLAAVWGGHQGSMLFWLFTLSSWAALVDYKLKSPVRFRSDVVWVMNLMIACFAWFTIFASNPFEFSSQYVSQGRDLNPMLQDLGLILHPPLLYLGYIGYSTVLAFAIAALMQDKVDESWVYWSRFWSVSSWLFLTAGILIGAWWAYKELGWGGWWFWDPVENASLLPWLSGTLLLHAQFVMRVGKALKLTTFVFAVTTFCLSILGTFIVRSGLITSVHAFASDPSIGVFLLLILAIFLIGGLLLLGRRLDQITSASLLLQSKYVLLGVIACCILVTALITVALGTFYPLFYSYVSPFSVSVGAPYFNAIFTPLTLLGLLVLGFAPLLKPNTHRPSTPLSTAVMLVVSVITGGLLYWIQVDEIRLWPILYWIAGSWVSVTHFWYWWKIGGVNHTALLAHFGIVVVAISAVMNAQHSFQVNRKIELGQSIDFSHWEIVYLESDWLIGGNYTAEKVTLSWSQSGKQRFWLYPEKRHYNVRVMTMSEPAIKRYWHGDYYVNLGEKLAAGQYSITIQYNAYIIWLWIGGLLIVTSGLVPFVRSIRHERKGGEFVKNI
ncbi:heme lyase CcmF/NrfE family subunit [Vibrio sonorensis]|uniref:heme lyase CcmF/NrfE family subunit n=1 Tax=Vibrio sonorensis TaxID=1004316 RepID=UPI0008D8E8B7|nr:cytochrome c-type biogenesis CcmF C-terminal domain-containing protein [Vibrio sonorensis]